MKLFEIVVSGLSSLEASERLAVTGGFLAVSLGSFKPHRGREGEGSGSCWPLAIPKPRFLQSGMITSESNGGVNAFEKSYKSVEILYCEPPYHKDIVYEAHNEPFLNPLLWVQGWLLHMPIFSKQNFKKTP